MKRFWITLLLCLSGIAVAAGITAISGLSSLTNQQEEIKSTANALWSYAASLLSGEDETNSVFRVEQQFSYKVCTADCQVKASAGFVHTVTCATPAGVAVAAGAVSIRDALTETTPLVATIGLANAAFTPFTLTLDTVMTTGIYLGYDGTVGAVSCTVSYR